MTAKMIPSVRTALKDKVLDHLEHCLECPLPVPGTFISYGALCSVGQALMSEQLDKVFGMNEVVQ